MWMIILTGVIAFAAWRTWLVYAQLRDHNKAIERAYVYVHQVASFENFAVGAKPVVLLTVVNSGHTPAWILESSAATIPVADVAKHLPRPMPVEHIGMRNQKQVVFAGVKTEWGHVLGPVQESDYTNVKNGTWRLVVFGRIHYRDTFNDRHYTDFSFVWDRFKEGKSGPSDFLIHPDGYTDAT